MNRTNKRAPQKKAERRLITFIICILLVGCIIGGTLVGVITAAAGTAPQSKYGTRDGKTIVGEQPYEYLSDSEFKPIECDLPVELQEYTYYLCQAYYIDFDFAMALMYTESSFKISAESSTSDYGLMQINKVNHNALKKELGITDFKEPYQNIRAGLYILRGLFEKYDNPALVCMAYNMGEYGASVLWEQGIYETTYSRKVLLKADEYAAVRE